MIVQRPVAEVVGPLKTSPGCGPDGGCSCRRIEHATKEVISLGLKLVRLRFSLPSGELPDLSPKDLDRYLLFQLGGGSRPSCPFPRSQTGWLGEFPSLRRLGRKDRWELAHSCASIKRSLPSLTCPVHPPPSRWEEWKAKACPDSPPLPSPEYLKFVRTQCRKLFSFGWDRSYSSFCDSFNPRASARQVRGERADLWWSQFSWLDWQVMLRHGRKIPKKEWKFRYKEIPTVGKVRPMGIPHFSWDLLGPLHKTMYQYISSKEWLCLGPPTEKKVKKVCIYPVQTSVDLVSATDGLFVPVAETILGVALAKSRIPGPIALAAVESLRPRVRGFEVTHGQMMGCYLSFPLLCIQSYLAALWAARGQNAKFLVNGDDTLISSEMPLGRYPDGFELNLKKTMSSPNCAELNSTVFIRSGERWVEVRHLRRGGFTPDFKGMIHAASVCNKAGPKWVSAFLRSKIGRRWDFLPSQLGFSLRNHDAFRIESAMKAKGRVFTPLPSRQIPKSRFSLVEELTDLEQICFRIDLFEGGREVMDRKEGREISYWEVKNSYLVNRFLRSNLTRSYDPNLAEPATPRNLFCVSNRFVLEEVEETARRRQARVDWERRDL
jgi:hypothetical protein